MVLFGSPGRLAVWLVCCAACCAGLPAAGQSLPQAPPPSQSAPAATGITLHQAIAAAMANDPLFAAAQAHSGSARLDASISRSTLLPNATTNDVYTYTTPSGYINKDAPEGLRVLPAFVANDSIHEYWAQILVNQNISLANIAAYRRNRALAAQAGADLESARRDLVARVVAAYFGVVDAAARAEVAKRAMDESQSFVDLTNKLEAGREVARADVVKADLEYQQRQREWGDAQLAANKARLDLGVLLFPDPRTPYTLADEAQPPAPLPDESTVEAAASHNNPDLRSALDALRAAKDDVSAARAAYLPTMGFNYTWGINAPQFAVNGDGGVRNLGYSASFTINMPLWDWFATQDKVRQSKLREQAAQAALTTTQRQLIAQLDEYYDEARVADEQVQSLRTSVATAQESLHLTRLRYRAGEALALEVVDAENSLAQAEDALADGLLRSRVARANLETLTGAL